MPDIKIQRGISLQPQNQSPEAKMREAAQMYEQHFLNEMVKSMRKTVEHGQITEPSMAEKIYSEQLDNQYVESWANQGGIGLADIIYNQLQDRFFNNGGRAPAPQGPMQIEKGTTIKIDESKQQGIPVVSPRSSLPSNEVSFLYEWDNQSVGARRDITNPYDGDILQSFRVGDDRQIVKIAHDNGLQSTISFLGQTKGLNLGDHVRAGVKLGTLSSYATGLTWQIGQVES